MNVTLPTELLAGFLLALVRTSAWLVVTPPFNSNAIPQRVKFGLSASLALVLAPTVTLDPTLFQFWPFATAVAYQAFVGLVLGFAVYLIFAVVQIAGELVDLQSGFSAASLYDPFTNAAATPIGRLYQLMAVTLLFAINGHLLLVRGFVNSYQAAPLSGVTLEAVASLFTTELGRFLMSAVEIAAPLVAALFLAELAMGLLNRAAPQMNVLTIGFIVKILLALLLVGVALPLLPGAVEGLLGDALTSMTRLTG
ncbi:MAG: flagellar biosynthetic protein FliR [Acidimicrobiia bacterium]